MVGDSYKLLSVLFRLYEDVLNDYLFKYTRKYNDNEYFTNLYDHPMPEYTRIYYKNVIDRIEGNKSLVDFLNHMLDHYEYFDFIAMNIFTTEISSVVLVDPKITGSYKGICNLGDIRDFKEKFFPKLIFKLFNYTIDYIIDNDIIKDEGSISKNSLSKTLTDHISNFKDLLRLIYEFCINQEKLIDEIKQFEFKEFSKCQNVIKIDKYDLYRNIYKIDSGIIGKHKDLHCIGFGVNRSSFRESWDKMICERLYFKINNGTNRYKLQPIFISFNILNIKLTQYSLSINKFLRPFKSLQANFPFRDLFFSKSLGYDIRTTLVGIIDTLNKFKGDVKTVEELFKNESISTVLFSSLNSIDWIVSFYTSNPKYFILNLEFIREGLINKN
ncbi:hypothetical protein HERIO_936 [Hepatospora eriocheir]|uniref:Uncharacterized protein n=1 Tax=Hepatospora eriocheir TaxID=1081669 RepID=A0A1X0QBU1_9MICR|nr:hypothetical protein HERIO_936 [Hepatospora eriocheir]